jgi:hypothetical protein
MVSVNDLADRPAKALADGETVSLGKARVRWLDAPHLPHGWECGYLFEETGGTLFCGDPLHPAGPSTRRLTTATSWGRARRCAWRWTTTPTARRRARLLEKLAATQAEDARLHARQRLVGGRRTVAPGPRRRAFTICKKLI